MRATLTCHPDTPGPRIRIDVTMGRHDGRWAVAFGVSGEVARIATPLPGPARRTDGLWQHTCFEAFVRPGAGESYFELNLSPSSEWAAYRFEAYRAGMADLAVDAPEIGFLQDEQAMELRADFTLPADVYPARLGLSAVIEEVSGRKSYWALAHPPGDKPDFHHPDCFALELPPATDT